jgi:ribonuclease R
VTRRGAVLVVGQDGRPLFEVDPDQAKAVGAMHGDRVIARRKRRRGTVTGDLPPGHIVRVVSRANETIVGRLERLGRDEWVVPDDPRLGPRVSLHGGSLGALPREKVVVAVSRFPGPKRVFPSGAVVERLGPAGEPDAETLAVIRSHGLRDVFPAEALAEAERLPREVEPAELAGRLDLTGEVVFTIDDAEARDLDDAVSISRSGKDRSWRLGVHVADVSHYVAAGSALDKEAERRGTSVYLADRVLPMFPPRLSNDIASLHPGVVRLTVSVFMDIDEHGRTTAVSVHASFIRSAARLTYDAAAAFLDGLDGGEDEGVRVPGPVGSALREMALLAETLRARRMRRGSLDFELPEEKVKLDGQGRPVEVVLRRRNRATQIIEEFMVAANEAVADYLLWHGVPFIRRVHEEPFPDDLEDLREVLAPLGYRIPTTRAPRPSDLQAVLAAARGRPEADDVHKAVLRALPQARYSLTPMSHYALALRNYTHFTSPIRRYPDLYVHRQVKAVLEGRAHAGPGEEAALVRRLAAVADRCSRLERAAEAAELESVEVKKVELARRCLGLEEEGVVTGVFDFGAFVRLPNGVEGLVPAGALGHEPVSRGGRLRVQVVRADIERRRVELIPKGER